jgi:hypothetical protein
VVLGEIKLSLLLVPSSHTFTFTALLRLPLPSPSLPRHKIFSPPPTGVFLEAFFNKMHPIARYHNMYDMEDAAVVALMRAQPMNPVDREDFEIQVSPGYKVSIFSY